MKSYKAAALKMNSQPDLEANLEQAAGRIAQAVERGSRLVGLPEHFAYFGDEKGKMTKADTIAEKSRQFLKEQAKSHGIYLLGGSFPEPSEDGRVYNRSLLLNPSGQVVAQYDKIHLFDVDVPDGYTYRESNNVHGGELEPVTFESDEVGKLGLTICYDLRFPELYRALARRGAEVLLVPSAFTALTGEAHWKLLLRARAVENTCYVLAPAQGGTHGPKRQTWGHPMIVDPWGKVFDEAGKNEDMAIAEINPERLMEIRRQMPSLQHIRLK